MLRPYPGMFGMQPIADSTGILIAGQEGRVVREDGTDADYNEPGELWLKGVSQGVISTASIAFL